jgi:YHS domain-containing protein
MKTKISLILSTITLLFASCSKEEAASADSSDSAQTKPYPLEVCLVSGEKLGSMGEPTSLTHEGQEIKFCCDSCEPRFKKDPAKYLSKLENP